MKQIRAVTLCMLLLTIAGMSTISNLALANTPWAEQVAAVIEPAVANGIIPGAAVVVVEDARVVFSGGFGVARPDGLVPDENTRYSIGSVSKSFTGLAVLVLAEQGKLDLDAAISTYLPDFGVAGMPESPITVRHLLNHTSGLSLFTGNRNQSASRQDDNALRDAVAELKNIPLQSPPGTQFDYSNANYQILGLLIEQTSGEPFPRAMRNLVLGPLGMLDTRIGHPFGAENTSDGYRYWFTSLVADAPVMSALLMPQGGITTTAADMGRYLIAHMGGDGETPDAWNKEMGNPHKVDPNNPYSTGWFVRGTAEDPLLTHTGLNAGFTAAAAVAPTRKLGVAVLINASDGLIAGDVNYLSEEVMRVVFPELPAHPVDFTPRWGQLIGALVLLSGLLLWIVLFARKPPSPQATTTFWIRLVLPTVLLVGLAYGTGVLLPNAFGIPLSGIRLFVPDIGWILTAITGLALCWALLRVVLLAVNRWTASRIEVPQ